MLFDIVMVEYFIKTTNTIEMLSKSEKISLFDYECIFWQSTIVSQTVS